MFSLIGLATAEKGRRLFNYPHAPVQEEERPLPQDDEGRVDELEQLAEDEEHGPEAHVAVAVREGRDPAVHLPEADGGEPDVLN